MKKTNLAIIFIIILGLATAYGYRRYTQRDPVFDLKKAGKPAPTFALPSIEDGQINLDDYKGKLVLLNFWASWCPPCRAEIPGFIKVQKKYNEYVGKPFTFIGVAIEDKKSASDFAKDFNINYPIAYGLENSLEVAGAYGDPDGALPYSVLISADQKILSIHAGFLSEDKLIEMIEKNLPK